MKIAFGTATLGLCLCLLDASFQLALAESGGDSSTSASVAGESQNSPGQEAKNAADLDLEQLANMEVKVTSASKKSESLFAAPAAIYVLTGEEILRGGFSSIPDALRMVPGLYVAQGDSHSWIVAARGFSYAFNNKMLVLIDGQLLYQPLDGGVYWDTIDPPLEDIDRIEIIRGPGGTLWGANAVNGVINIITKNSRDTEGALMAVSGGLDERDKANVRYGGGWGPNLTYRVFGQAMYGSPSVDAVGQSQDNGWNLSQGGMRVDWKISPKDNFTFEGQGQGGAVRTDELNFSGPAADSAVQLEENILMRGGSILGRWDHHFSERSSTDVLAYCSWFDRIDILGGDIRNTCDVELQHDFIISPRQLLIWGASILSTVDTPTHTFELSYANVTERDNTYSAFGQYEITAVADRLRFIGGAKFEHNPFTGFEIQPQIRGVWTPNTANTVWGAVSRAIVEPSRFNSDADLKVGEIPGGPLPVFLAVVGNEALTSESVRAYELGYRYRLRQNFSFDTAAFYNHYEDLIDVGPPVSARVFPTYVEVPLQFENSGIGQTHGLEFSARWRANDRFSFNSAITEIRGDATPGTQAVVTPRHILNLQPRVNLTRHFNFDTSYYYTGAIHSLALPTINRVDAGFSTNAMAGFSFSIWGRNLQTARHLENTSSEPYFPAGEVRRSLVLKMVWQPGGK